MNGRILIIDHSVAEADQIIENLLVYVRINMPKHEKILCGGFIEDCLEGVKHKYKDWDVEIKKTCNCGESDFFEADKIQMKEVVDNILDNAYEALGGKEGKITVEGFYDKDKNKFDIIVKDAGAGIESGKLERIFEPFFSAKTKGIGLGLLSAVK